jgi:hypothetical protein
MDYPRWMYHPDGRTFICPSAEFMASLTDKHEWEDAPFTGPRRPVPPKCPGCAALQRELAKAKADLVDLTKAQLELVNSAISEEPKKHPGRPRKVEP